MTYNLHIFWVNYSFNLFSHHNYFYYADLKFVQPRVWGLFLHISLSNSVFIFSARV